MASASRDPPDRPLMRVSWFFDAGYHVEVGDAEEHNLRHGPRSGVGWEAKAIRYWLTPATC
jgi:hypothetical protein